MPAFYPEATALAFHSRARSITTGATALVFLGVRRYFSGQSGSHGLDLHGMAPPLYKHGARCGSLAHAQLFPRARLLRDAVTVPRPGAGGAATVTLYAHALGVLTSSRGVRAGRDVGDAQQVHDRWCNLLCRLAARAVGLRERRAREN